jgi:tripartite-type tricarboxylate transporter receptor subunit TctC
VGGPKGLPLYITKKLEDAFARATKQPSFIQVMEKMCSPIVYMNSEEMGKYIDKTYKKQQELFTRLKAEDKK